MEKEFVTVVGSLNYDLIIKQQRMPMEGETFTGEKLISSPGGKGANQAVQCAKLNLETYMVGKVGCDNFGLLSVNAIRSVGVNCDSVWTADTNNGLGIVHLLPDGNYYSTILTGANFKMDTDDIDKIEPIIAKSRIVILQMEIPTEVVEYTIELAAKYGCYIILNLAPPKAIREDILKKVNCLIVNETEASFLVGRQISSREEALEISKSLREKIKDLLIITLGIKGSIGCNGTQKVYMPTNDKKALDATGAGDSFIGAVAYGLYHNVEDIAKILKFATYTSSVSITKYGGQESFPCLDELPDTDKILF